MNNIFYFAFIVAIYFYCLLVKVKTEKNITKTYDCPVNASCVEVAVKIFNLINDEREKIYKDTNYDLIPKEILSESALNWSKTEPEGWDYDKQQCNFLQQGVSYWEQTDGKTYINVPMDAIITKLVYTNKPTYTCGVGHLFDVAEMRDVKFAGVGVWTNPKNNTRGTGKVKGVQIWIFVHYSLPPSFVPPIIHTVTPPPDPDATTGPSTTAKPISTTTTNKPSPTSTTAPPSTTKPASTTTAKPTSKTTTKPTTTTTTTKPTTKKSTSKPALKTTPNPASKPTNPPKKTKKPHDQTAEPDTVLTETPEPVETTVLTTENPNDTSSEKIDPNQE